MRRALLLSTLLLLAAAPANARPSGGKLAAAQAEFNRGNYQGALKLLEAAEGETTDDDTLARIQLLQGQAYGAQRDFARTEERFAAALGRDPEIALDPAKVDPDLVKILEGLRDRLQGELKVQADRAGARVYLDGKMLGTVPVRASVSIGRHQVEVRSADGQYSASRKVVVYRGRSIDLNLTLDDRASEAPGPSASGDGQDFGDGGAPVLLGFGKPFADLRLGIEPFQLLREGVAIEVGGGLESQFLRFSAHFRVFPAFGVNLRGAFSVPVVEQFRGYVSLELPFIFFDGSLAFGLGGSGGAEYLVGKWLSVFVEVGARHYFITPNGFDDNRLTLQAGVRLRLP